jgi:hypothetical protein
MLGWSGVAAVVATNCVIASYVIMAWNEDKVEAYCRFGIHHARQRYAAGGSGYSMYRILHDAIDVARNAKGVPNCWKTAAEEYLHLSC